MSQNQNPFTQIENRFDCVDQSIEALKQFLLVNINEASTKDIGGVEEATEVTGLSSHSIYRLVSQRKIPHSKKGGRLYVSRALRKWIGEGERKGVTV